MTNVLIRDVPSEDLDRIRAEASAQGVSLQSYLRDALHAQARHLRRREALNRTADRLRGGPDVPEQERQNVLESIDSDHTGRAEDLADRAAR